MRAPKGRSLVLVMSVAQSASSGKKTISISQRWPTDIRDELNQAAQRLGVSATQITVECLTLFLNAHKNHPHEANILRLLKKAYCPASPPKESSSKHHDPVASSLQQSSSPRRSRRVPTRYGFKKQIIFEYLKEHAGKVFVNPELAEQLGIPESTVRRYTNELAKDGKIVLIPGRPNGIMYSPS